MELTILRPVISKLDHWRMSLFLGILFILLGISKLLLSIKNYEVLYIFLGMMILISGVGEIMFSLLKRKRIQGWGWFLASGLTDFSIGIVFIYTPVITFAILSLYVAFWLLFRCIMAIGVSAAQQYPAVLPWQSLLIFVLATMGFAFYILMYSFFDVNNVMKAIPFFCVLYGIWRIILALGLKQILG